MTDIADDFKQLIPHISAEEQGDREYLWVYEPPEHEGKEGKIHLANARTEHPADFPTHEDIATHVHHPDRRDGYAYEIKGGWRLTDSHHKSIRDDPYLEKLILAALRQEDPPQPLPRIRYHGDPGDSEEHHA